MKQYKISFFAVLYSGAVAEYYREFENKKQAKEWADYLLNKGTTYTSYKIEKCTIAELLENQ